MTKAISFTVSVSDKPERIRHMDIFSVASAFANSVSLHRPDKRAKNYMREILCWKNMLRDTAQLISDVDVVAVDESITKADILYFTLLEGKGSSGFFMDKKEFPKLLLDIKKWAKKNLARKVISATDCSLVRFRLNDGASFSYIPIADFRSFITELEFVEAAINKVA